MTTLIAIIAAIVLLAASPSFAVGLGPLSKSGITDGPGKGFYLTLYNPYHEHAFFNVYAVANDDETAAPRVRVPQNALPLRPEASRKFLIAVTDLAPGEVYKFRVCAERSLIKDEPIHARVCSRLTARRVAAGPGLAGAGVN
ncbi:MAG: hypothetical protein ABI898_06475 [Sphingomonadales bacterium]